MVQTPSMHNPSMRTPLTRNPVPPSRPSVPAPVGSIVQVLRQMGVVDAPAAAPSLVDGLGRWVHWTDTIPLSAVLHAPPPTPAVSAEGGHAEAARLQAALAALRASLEDAITAAGAPAAAPARERGGRRDPAPPAAPEPHDDPAPHRERYLALQREMDAAITPLRQRLRAALGARSPALARLSALDAVLADLLDAREHHLLASLPGLLERRFVRLRRDAGEAPPGPAAAPPPWLAGFRLELQQLLRAELALRLQPLDGLLAALQAPTPDRP